MGVWDLVENWLGGGAKLHLHIEVPRVPAGGLLSGTVRVEAGRRGVEVDGLRVCLLRTAVRTRDGAPAGDIVQRTMVDAVVGSGLRLTARADEEVGFAIRVPHDAAPSDDETSYRVRVELRAPDGKTARAQKQVRIVDAVAVRPALETIYDRWPALREGAATTELADALRELRFHHDAGDPAADLLAVEPRLAQLLCDPEPAVRDAALAAWTGVLEGRGTKAHLARLQEIADTPGADTAWLARLADAAGIVGAGASLPFLRALAAHEDPAVRRAVALAITRLPAGVSAKRSVLDELARDGDALVRAAVYRAYADFAHDAEVVGAVAAHTTMEPSPAVLEACLFTLRGAFAHGHGDVAKPVIERLSTHPSPQVRTAVARTMGVADGDLASRSLVDALLGDAVPEVRIGAVAELRQLGPAAATFLGRLEQLATEDPAPEVRAAALATLPVLVAPGELCEYYRAILDAEPPIEVVRGILQGIRQHRAPDYQSLLDELVDHPDRALAADARELLDAAS